MLGRLLEIVSGACYADVLRREIFERFGLENTGVDDGATLRDNAADPYTSYALGEFERAREWDPSWKFGTAGLYSNVADLARWNQALRHGFIVKPETFALMVTSGVLNDGRRTHYGFGLFEGDVQGVREIRHSGRIPGFTLENATYPDHDLDIVVLTNQDDTTYNYTITRPLLALLLDRPELAAEQGDDEQPVSVPVTPPALSDWISAAREGRLDDFSLSASFRRFLTPERRAQLKKLAELGELRSADYIAAGRREPVTFFDYRVVFENKITLATISMMDNGDIRFLDFNDWNDHPIQASVPVALR